MAAVSEKSWSDYKAVDYTPEQWHAACLIHQHQGAPTSKNQCKLPVRTPEGVLNRNGVHAAAGALAGARGGVIASPPEKASAALALVRAYSQLKEEPPPSLKNLTHSDELDDFLAHAGVKGMKWGVRRDERALSDKDKALNLSQRSQVQVASTISALAAVGMASNAAATLFQLQSRFEHLRVLKEMQRYAENSPYIDDAGREALRQTRSHIMQGLVGSAIGATAISVAVGIVTRRTAMAYFAPLHKVYGDSKPKINGELKALSNDIKKGKRPKLTSKQYETEVASIVKKHMTKDASNALRPFHELARSQLGTELNTKSLKISFQKLPNTDLVSKMTVTTPTGLKLVKAIKNVKHAESEGELAPDLELFFDYKFDADGYVIVWSCPTIELADDLFKGRFDIVEATKKFDAESNLHHIEKVDDFLAHHGVKGMKWGVHKKVGVVGLTDLDAGGLGSQGVVRTLAGNSKKTATSADHTQAALITRKVRQALLHMDTGPMSPKGSVTTITKRYRQSGSALTPSQKVKYDREIESNLDKHAKKLTPKGADARVVFTPTTMHLIVGSKKTVAAVADVVMRVDSREVTHSEIPAIQETFKIIRDNDGFIVRFEPTSSSELKQSILPYVIAEGGMMPEKNDPNDFLVHIGVKGMKWGIRKSRELVGRGKSKTPDNTDDGNDSTIKTMHKLKPGSVVSLQGADGNARTLIKKQNGTWVETHLSADAERSVRTQQKENHEMSDREMKEAVTRANNIKAYNEMFSTNPHAALQSKVNEMKLQSEYAQYHAKIHPSKAAKVASLMATAGKVWDGYQKVDSFYKKIQGEKAAKNRPADPLSVLKKKNDLLEAQQTFDRLSGAQKAFQSLTPKHTGSFKAAPTASAAPFLKKYLKNTSKITHAESIKVDDFLSHHNSKVM